MTDSARAGAMPASEIPANATGVVRIEVEIREDDQDLLRQLARKLVEKGKHADELRRSLRDTIEDGSGAKGGILTVFLASPFAGSNLDLGHPFEPGRATDL